jgi:hypothetical protein
MVPVIRGVKSCEARCVSRGGMFEWPQEKKPNTKIQTPKKLQTPSSNECRKPWLYKAECWLLLADKASLWPLMFGVWCLVFGVWCLVFEAWCLRLGV